MHNAFEFSYTYVGYFILIKYTTVSNNLWNIVQGVRIVADVIIKNVSYDQR